jgi:hypothetical protein
VPSALRKAPRLRAQFHDGRTATFETIRCTFLKIAVRIQELKTRIKMALPSSYPNVQALTALATSIAALAP